MITTEKENIKISIQQVVSDAAHFQEWADVLSLYLYKTRGLLLNYDNPGVHEAQTGKRLYYSASITACLEWALKQPIIGEYNNE